MRKYPQTAFIVNLFSDLNREVLLLIINKLLVISFFQPKVSTYTIRMNK